MSVCTPRAQGLTTPVGVHTVGAGVDHPCRCAHRGILGLPTPVGVHTVGDGLWGCTPMVATIWSDETDDLQVKKIVLAMVCCIKFPLF